MKKLSVFLVLLCFIGLQAVTAQNRDITGVVTSSEDGLTLPGVSVVVKGTTIGSVTNIDGVYTLNVPESAEILVFSFVGMRTVEVEISGQSTIDLLMEADVFGLDEVVVVAYGTAKKSSFIGSASFVKSEKLEQRPVTSVLQALQGNSSGLQVTNSSGQPGSNSQVRIRGIGSVNAASSPLYVVDGIAINSGNYSSITNTVNYGTSSNVIATLNPGDIESITILKDASAASLYGSRAANGVIVIQTKKGQEGKTRVNFTAQRGLSSRAVKGYDLLNAADYYQNLWLGMKNSGMDGGMNETAAMAYADAGAPGFAGRNPYSVASPYNSDGSLVAGTEQIINENWLDEILRTGVTEEYGINASGGNDKLSFYLSANYFGQEGIVDNSDFERISGKLNLTNQTTDFLKLGVNTTFTRSIMNTPPGAGGAANPIRFGYLVPGTNPIYIVDANGDYVLEGGKKQYEYSNPLVLDFNPFGIGEMDTYNTKTNRILVDLNGEVTFLKDFVLKSIFAIDYLDLDELRFYNPDHGNGASVGGRSDNFRKSDLLWTWSNTLTYDKTFGNHHVNALLGQEALKSTFDYLNAEATNFPFGGTTVLAAAATPVTTFSYIDEHSMTSYFSRVNYDYGEKYFLSLSFRRDGSSRFGEENKFGNFFSVGASWRLSSESFMPEISWLDDARLRASYGTSGNENIDNYLSKGLFEYGYNYDSEPGMQQIQLANPILTWEQNEVLDVALDFRLFNRISASVDYYLRTSKDLLLEKPLSMTSGFDNIISNIGEMKNFGWEFELVSSNIETNQFSWITNLNLTLNKNEWIDLPQDQILDGSKVWEVGYSRYEFYIREWAGVDPATGEAMWYIHEETEEGDRTGIKTLTKNYSEATRTYMGSALPDFFGGFTNNFKYKGFDLSIFIFYSYGGLFYDYDEATLMHDGATPSTNLLAASKDAWTEPGDITNVPKYVHQNNSTSNDRSSRFLHDASYLRLKNVTLSYNLPRSLCNRIKLDNVRIFVQGDNLLTWAAYRNRDPEGNLAGTANTLMPNIKTFTVGLRLGL